MPPLDQPSMETVPCPRCGGAATCYEYGVVWCEAEDELFWGDFEAVVANIDVVPEPEPEERA
jgi:hypothetical protein